MIKNQSQIYIVIIVATLIFLVLPIISQQQIIILLKDGTIIGDPRFEAVKKTGSELILEQFETTTISKTKVDVLIYNETNKDCILSRVITSPCIPVFNTTVWTVPSDIVKIKINVDKGIYYSQIISYFFENTSPVEKSRKTLIFKVD